MKLQPQWRNTDLLGDSSYVAAPFLADLSELTVVHLIRPPLDHIRSVCGIGWLGNPRNPWVAFIDHFADVLRYPAGPQRAAAQWLAWNALVEPHADLTWRLPDIDHMAIRDLAEMIDAEPNEKKIESALERTSKRTNHRKRAAVEFDDLGPLRDVMAERAEKYKIPLVA